MNTVKIVAFAIGFVALFGAMFWLGHLAPGDDKNKQPESEKGK